VTQSILSLNADSRSTSPARNSSIFVMSDGALVAIWVEGRNGPATDRVVRRYRSIDGIVWSRLSDLLLGTLLGTTDPDGSKQIYPLFSQSVTGSDTIAAFAIAVPASASFMFVMNYSAVQKDFTADTLIGTYTPTNAWDGLGTGTGTTRSGYTDYGKMLYDSTHTDHIAVFDALVAGQEYIYLIAWDTATGKVTELRFTNAANQTCRFPDFAIVTGTPSTIALVYQRTNYAFRTYTYDGATFSAGAAEEVIPGSPTISAGGPRLFVNNNGNFQIVYENFTTSPALITRERTGVATYSAALEIATDLPYGAYLSTVGPEDQFAIKKVGTDDFYVFYKKTTTSFRGELYYVRRNAGTWGAQTAWKTGANGFNHPSAGAFVVGADHKLHMLFSRGANIYPTTWTLMYDFLYDGTPSSPTSITPITRGEVSATPTITAKYKNLRAGDSSSKVRVRVLRSSDSTVFWDLGGAGGTAAVVAVDGIYSVLYAGTALVEGTDYYIEINFWDTQESYAGPIGTTVATPFAWNDPPSKIAVALTSDPANGRQRTALYPLAPASATTEKAPVTGDLWRKLSTDAQFTSLKSGLAFTAPTTQTGFSAYRQCPNLGLARNLVVNGGFQSGAHSWTIPQSQFSVIADATSPTGFALRAISNVATVVQSVPIEAGKAYSCAIQMRGDGTNTNYMAFQWTDALGIFISEFDTPASSTASWVEHAEAALTNVVAPGNARFLTLIPVGGAGISFFTAFRVMQQTTVPAAWTAAHQQYVSRGLDIYEGGTNLAADGDMEAVGTASFAATNATLSKDTTNPFAGAKRLKVVNTAANGYAQQSGALAAGQAVTVSVRCIGADAGAGLQMFTTPSNVSLGTDLGASADYAVRRVSGVIAGGDTGWIIRMIGGTGAAVTSYFDNLAVENKAYDTMNADPSGLAYATGARTLSDVRLPLPTDFSISDFAVAGVYRADHAYNLGPSDRYLFEFYFDTSNRTGLHINANVVQPFKVRAGIVSGISASITFAAGDTVSWAIRYSATAGLVLYTSLNGAAVVTNTLATPEAMLALSGTPSVYLGASGTGALTQQDGTTGVFRILKGGLSDATLSALVLDPYQSPTDNDLAVWDFEGFAFQVPTYNDRLVKLGPSYDYRAVGTAAAATPTQSTGQQTSGSVAVDSRPKWFLKDSVDATKDTQIEVINQFPFSVPRRVTVVLPLAASRKVAIRSPYPTGMEGTLKLRFTSLTDQVAKEAAIRDLMASNNVLYLQSPFGQLIPIALTAPLNFIMHETILEADLTFTEV
jgi:hypothetical protein